MQWISNQASYVYNSYNDYMHPSYKISSLEAKKLPGLVDSDLFEANDQDHYLIHDKHSTNVKDVGLINTCNAIVEKGIKFASVNLNVKLRYGVILRSGTCENFSKIISNMLSKSNCQLEYLDVSDSSLTSDELIEMLQASTHSSLKCIYIGSNDWSKESVAKLYDYLINNSSKVLILGLHNLLILDDSKRLTWKEFSESASFSEIAKFLDDYNLEIAPELNLDARLNSESVRVNDTGQRIFGGSTYH